MTRQVSLNALKAGISRLRIKGSPNPETLYDLVNGYVTQAGTVESRPGTVRHAQLPPGTKGLCAFEGQLYVFSDSAKAMPAGYVCEILIHPTDTAATLVRIHFARPYLGALYVAAEWSDGSVYHYWLQQVDTWQADRVYAPGDLVQPSVPNGFAYRATRLGEPAQLWAPNVARAIGDRVLPTAGGAYEHVVVDVTGANPRSAPTEPTWANTDGGITYEDADNAAPAPPAGGGGGGETPPPIPPRYGPGGGGTNPYETVQQ